MPKLRLPDGTMKDYAEDVNAEQMAADVGAEALAARVNGSQADLRAPLAADAEVCLVDAASPEGLELLRHSTSHVMAAAVRRLFGDVKYAIGPAIEEGFYYDFDLSHRFGEDDLAKIEAEMQAIIDADEPFERVVCPRADVVKQMQELDQPYKLELLDELTDEEVPLYRTGEFVDLCLGPHIPSAGKIKAFKLLNVAGAYWRGLETNQMLQRIYGIAFPTKEELDKHLEMLAEAKARDHRTLGKALDLYSVHEEVGPGLIHWHPKGALVRHVIETLWRDEHMRRGYELVYTPHIASERIYAISGHLENYAENMYAPMDIEDQPYRLKPMNCPGHIKIFQTGIRSYRDLPMRYAELGTVYRYERSGVLHGMLRVRGFTQDDSHIFCTQEQLPGEVAGILDLVDFMMRAFGYTYRVRLATRPEKSLGTDAEWEWSTEALREALGIRGLDYTIDEGGGVFYAPKIDIVLCDALGREWQGPTIQVDLNLPKRFDVSYVGPDGKEHETVIVHRTVLGSMERFIGGLIEHYAGAFPLWLAPVQVRILPITDGHHDYARLVEGQLREAGLRAESDVRNEKVGFKIREATVEKVPYMLIVGNREAASGSVSVRSRKDGDVGSRTVSEFVEAACQENCERR